MFDDLTSGGSIRRHDPSGVEPPTFYEGFPRRTPFLWGPAAVGSQALSRGAPGRGLEDERLTRPHPVGHQAHDMPIAPVLAKSAQRLPEGNMGLWWRSQHCVRSS